MTIRPGTQILVIDSTPPSSGPPTDTDTLFIVGKTERGDHTAPVRVTSLDQHDSLLGSRVSYGVVRDQLEAYFRTGGSVAYVGRVVGPTPVKATASLWDVAGTTAPGDVSLTATARDAGEWINDYELAVTVGGSGGSYRILTLTNAAGTVLEVSPEYDTQADLIAWASLYSEYYTLALGASAEMPRVQADRAFAGGDSDYADAVDAQWQDALDLFEFDLGPGQVCAPGRTTAAAHEMLLLHAEANNRVALCVSSDTATVATLTAAVTTAQDDLDLETAVRSGAMFAPIVEVPGLLPATVRELTPEGLVAGKIAFNDRRGVSPNKPSANELGVLGFANGPKYAFTEAERSLLNAGGVNMVIDRYGATKIYGYRTMANPLTDPGWINFGNARLLMAIKAKLNAVAERFVLREIDGAGLVISQFGGELAAELMPYFTAGSLYGSRAEPDNPDRAFVVDVGPSVNTEETIADGELRAVIGVRLSPFAELVTVEIVKVPTTEEIAA